MKIIDVSWVAGQKSTVRISVQKPQQHSAVWPEKGVSVDASSKNLIVITGSGGVLRHWPRPSNW